VGYRSQERLTVQQPECLPVVGRPDLVVQVSDWQALIAAADDGVDSPGEHPRTEAQRRALQVLLAGWRRRYPQGLATTVFEVKSVNSAAFKYHRGQDGLSNAYPHHRLQLYTYMRCLEPTEGHLLYVARNTGWMELVDVRETEELEEEWIRDVATMTRYYVGDERPPLEPAQLDGKANWRVEYSRYKDYLVQAQEVPHGAFSF